MQVRELPDKEGRRQSPAPALDGEGRAVGGAGTRSPDMSPANPKGMLQPQSPSRAWTPAPSPQQDIWPTALGSPMAGLVRREKSASTGRTNAVVGPLFLPVLRERKNRREGGREGGGKRKREREGEGRKERQRRRERDGRGAVPGAGAQAGTRPGCLRRGRLWILGLGAASCHGRGCRAPHGLPAIPRVARCGVAALH